MLKFVLYVFMGCGSLKLIAGHGIWLDPGIRSCFYESLQMGGKLRINYEVDPQVSGSKTTDLHVFSPIGEELLAIKDQSSGTYHVQANVEGRFHYCFTSASPTKMRFSLQEKLESSNTRDPLENAMRQLTMGLRAIRDEQEYLVLREKVHNQTAQSTNSRVLWWAILQYFLLVSTCVWQVYYLKRFFEVRHRVR